MKEHKITRRNFLRTTVTGTAAVGLTGATRASAGVFEPVRIEEPFHGAVLNRRHGEEINTGAKAS